MRKFAFSVASAVVISCSADGLAQELVIFSSGQTASAADMNFNFQLLQDQINAQEAAEFGPEWYLQPSASGEISARNVIVLKGDLGGTGACDQDTYLVRTHFTNTESLSVNNASGPVVPDIIFAFGFVCAERGNPAVVNYQSEYIYALPDDPDSVNPAGAFESALGVEINEDFNADGVFDDQNNAYDYALTYTPNALRNSVVTQELEVFRTGNQNVVVNNYSGVLAAFPLPVEIPAPVNQTFTEVMTETRSGYGAGNSWVRFHARDVGAVQLVRDAKVDDPVYSNQTRFDVVYYRIDGVATGSLDNTPLAAGNPSAGIWFTP